MKPCASSPSGNEPASHAAHTTPPAAPEKPTRCSRSPQLAQAPSCGASPAASSSFRRNASAPPWLSVDPSASAPRVLVEQRQLAAQQVEHAGVRLRGLEQPPHRVARARRRVQAARVTAQARVAIDRLRAGDRQQLAPAFVQLDVQAEERLQAPAEAAARAPHALRDRAHAPALRRVQVQDAVRLAVAHRAQHHRFGLHSSACHGAMVIDTPDALRAGPRSPVHQDPTRSSNLRAR